MAVGHMHPAEESGASQLESGAHVTRLADHQRSIDGPTEPAISFTIDALGRSKTRQVGAGTTETLHYAGASDAVTRIGGRTPEGEGDRSVGSRSVGRRHETVARRIT
jgi:hypothetical protein